MGSSKSIGSGIPALAAKAAVAWGVRGHRAFRFVGRSNEKPRATATPLACESTHGRRVVAPRACGDGRYIRLLARVLRLRANVLCAGATDVAERAPSLGLRPSRTHDDGQAPASHQLAHSDRHPSFLERVDRLPVLPQSEDMTTDPAEITPAPPRISCAHDLRYEERPGGIGSSVRRPRLLTAGEHTFMIDDTHNPRRRSWVASAEGHPDFPIQNLPLGIFTPPGGIAGGGVAIGDEILDLAAALELGLFSGLAAEAARAASGATLNPLLALGRDARVALRRRVGEILDADWRERDTIERERAQLLHRAADCRLDLPAAIGGYTDFFAGIHHATNAGKLFRPDNPLMPNYKYVPIGYHGRTSSIGASPARVRRPNGQRKPASETVPTFGPSRNLDFELELGVWIGPGNALGEPIPIGEAAQHVAGFCLLNDWSARDIQGWEYQPLGPFLGKSFATTVSPWVITAEALAPFRMAQAPRPAGDPQPLPYLSDGADQSGGALDIELEVLLLTLDMQAKGLAPYRLAASNARHLYWTVAQLVAHHTSNGCNLRPGDILGTGTISGPDQDSLGSLLEITAGGKQAVTLPSGENRRFLEDGDTVILRAHCKREGFAGIGFGECRGTIAPAQ
jgi:fumarylacetoacetase